MNFLNYTSMTTGNIIGRLDVLLLKKSPILFLISSFTYDQLTGNPCPADLSTISTTFLRVWRSKSFDSRK